MKTNRSIKWGSFPIVLFFLFFILIPFSKGEDQSDRSEKNEIVQEKILFEEWTKKLNRMIDKCDELGMKLEAEICRKHLLPSMNYGFVLSRIPGKKWIRELPEDASDNQIHWLNAFHRLREKYGDQMYRLAEQALKEKKGYDAFRLYYLALSIDSDHEGSRKRCGYSFIKDRWCSTFEKKQLEKGLVDHPRFGWISKENVERYEKGDRFFMGKWISVEEETQLRRERKIGWKIETEHYSMSTTYSLEEGVRIVRRLENFYQAWTRLFYRFMARENQWTASLLSGRRLDTKKHKIILYCSRQEYLQEMKRIDPSGHIENSHGGYFPDISCICVYVPTESEASDLEIMLIHEATHQLFQECRFGSESLRRSKLGPGPIKQNFWLLEGISTYMETFVDDGFYYSIGGLRSLRFERAKERCVEPEGYLSLKEYSRLSMIGFQTWKDVPMLYTQAAGLTLFFLHKNDGEYRNAFISTLYAVYERMDSPNTLEKLTQKSFNDLDEEYKQFMIDLPFPKWKDQ